MALPYIELEDLHLSDHQQALLDVLTELKICLRSSLTHIARKLFPTLLWHCPQSYSTESAANQQAPIFPPRAQMWSRSTIHLDEFWSTFTTT